MARRETAVRELSANTDGWVILGLTYLQLGRAPEAVGAYETALAQRPENPLAFSGAAGVR